MCLAIPGIVETISDGEAVVDYGGLKKRAECMLVPDLRIGDRVLIHAGFIIARLDPEQGDEMIELNRQVYGDGNGQGS